MRVREFVCKFVQKCVCEHAKTVRERPLMMSDFRRDGEYEMTPKNWTLEGKNRTSGGNRTPLMDVPKPQFFIVFSDPFFHDY